MSPGPTWNLRYPSAELARHYRASGWWNDETLADIAFTGVANAAAVSCRVRSHVHPYLGTIGAVGDMGRRLAGTLAQHGVVAGDVVAFQLPNWVEAAACFYGLLPMGVVVVPIVHIYGTKEVGHILRQSQARALITADHFGRQDYVANLEAGLSDLPDLELVIVVPGDNGPIPNLATKVISWSDVLGCDAPLDRPARVDPDSPALIGYTSGTTASPKGVIHTHRTYLSDQRTWASFLTDEEAPAPGARATIPLTATPVGHIIGLTSVLGPLFWARPLDLMDVWDAGEVLAAMVADGVSTGGGPPFFLMSLINHPDFDPTIHLPSMQRLTMGGAPIPLALGRQASELGISIVRAYGSTEHPSTTASMHSDSFAKRILTDGRPLSGTELRLVDPDGHPVGVAEPGEIYSRGPELFAGYIDPELTAEAIDAAGWYDTGDVGVLDEDGYLTITDRKKDIIIRGGENVSSAEVESVLAGMVGVAEIAVVAAPDDRYGEHGAAVIKLLPGASSFDIAAIRQHLDAGGLARQKWPEELRFVEEFPRTPSGKIQKNVLRAALREPGDHVLPFEVSDPETP